MKKELAQFSGFCLPQTPSYISNYGSIRPCTVIVHEMREKIIEGISYSTALTYQKQNLAVKFFQLSTEIISDYFYKTSPATIQSHPSYIKIIAMGKDAIPLLIRELDKNPTYWLPALRILSDANPIKPTNKGVLSLMVNDWKTWAVENGYVQ